MVDGSRRGSVQTVQGFCVSILPQVLQTWTLSIATCRAADSGVISASRFLIRCSAARRAERGPKPGQPRQQLDQALDFGTGNAGRHLMAETKPGRQAEAAGQRLHLLLHRRFGLAARIAERGDQQILEHLALFRLHQRGSILTPFTSILAVMRTATRPPPEMPSTSTMVEFVLHRLHLGLQLLPPASSCRENQPSFGPLESSI